MRLAAGIRPDPLGSLQRSSRPSSWILGIGAGKGGEGKGEGEGKGRGERRREEREGKGEGRKRVDKKAGYGPVIAILSVKSLSVRHTRSLGQNG